MYHKLICIAQAKITGHELSRDAKKIINSPRIKGNMHGQSGQDEECTVVGYQAMLIIVHAIDTKL